MSTADVALCLMWSLGERSCNTCILAQLPPTLQHHSPLLPLRDCGKQTRSWQGKGWGGLQNNDLLTANTFTGASVHYSKGNASGRHAATNRHCRAAEVNNRTARQGRGAVKGGPTSRRAVAHPVATPPECDRTPTKPQPRLRAHPAALCVLVRGDAQAHTARQLLNHRHHAPAAANGESDT